jgi:hypothetical protein
MTISVYAVFFVALLGGCGDTRISSPSSSSTSFDPFKDEINKRFRTAYGSRDQYFSKDFDVSIELLETAPVRAVQNGEFGSPQDMLALRKSFNDLVGEIQNQLDIVWSDRVSFVRRITPQWYRTIPIQVVNLLTAASLIRRASEAKSDRDYSLFLHQSNIALTLPMFRPESPFDVFPLISLAKTKCDHATLSEEQKGQLHIVPDESDLEACTEDAFWSVSSLWVLTVVNAKIGLFPQSLTQRLNWGIALIRHYGEHDFGTDSQDELLGAFLKSLRLYLVGGTVKSPEDLAYPNKLLSYMSHLDRVIPVRVGCEDKPHIFCQMTEPITDGLQLDPRGPIRDPYPN